MTEVFSNLPHMPTMIESQACGPAAEHAQSRSAAAKGACLVENVP
jgi:hypothetical protein